MGLRLPDPPYDSGDDCLACWPTGKTPDRVYIRFWDVTTCPGCPSVPNGYTIICPQDPINPCYYHGQLSFGGYLWTAHWFTDYYRAGSRYSEISLAAAGSPCTGPFWKESAPCTQDYDNFWTECSGIMGGHSGHVHVSIFIDPIIIILTSGYHFVTVPGILYDTFDVTSPNAVYHIAHTNDKTNVLFLINKDEIEY